MSLIPSPDQRRLNSTIEALREDKRQLQDENKQLRQALVKIENMSRYDTNHDNMLYAVKDINTLARKLLNL